MLLRALRAFLLVALVGLGGDAVALSPQRFIVLSATPTIADLFKQGQAGAYFVVDPATLSQTSDGLTPITAVDDPVGFLPDISGNGRTLTQATDTTRPLYKFTNGHPNIAFDGTNDYLFRTASMGLFNAGASAAFWCQGTALATSRYAFSEGNSASANGYYGGRSQATSTTLGANSADDAGTLQINGLNLALLAFNAAPRVFGIVDDGTSLTGYVNGVASPPVAYTRGVATTLNRFALAVLLRSTLAGYMNLSYYAGVYRPGGITGREIRGVVKELRRRCGA